MAPNPRRQDERLDKLYAQLPVMECKGLCQECCGPIAMSLREQDRIGGAKAPGGVCEHLHNGRCSVYEKRPMICRLWGMTEVMPCPYGCEPVGGRLSREDAALLIRAADEIGGVPAGRRAFIRAQLEREARKMAAEFDQDLTSQERDEIARAVADELEHKSIMLHASVQGARDARA